MVISSLFKVLILCSHSFVIISNILKYWVRMLTYRSH